MQSKKPLRPAVAPHGQGAAGKLALSTQPLWENAQPSLHGASNGVGGLAAGAFQVDQHRLSALERVATYEHDNLAVPAGWLFSKMAVPD